MKKFIYYIPLLAIIISFFLIISLNACREEIAWSGGIEENIELTIKGYSIVTCDGTTTTEGASGATIIIVQDNDTIITSTLDYNGLFIDTMPNSKYGVSSIKLIATYNSAVFIDSTGFMCCDTNFVFNFETNCDEISEAEISCESIDTTIDISLANQYKGCLIVGAIEDEIKWNTVSITSTDELTFDLSAIDNLSEEFTANVSPTPSNDEITLSEGESLNLTFFVNTDTEGTFEDQLTVPVTCTDSSGSTTEGEIVINIDAEVCADNCVCPFSNDGSINKTINETSNGIAVDNTMTFENLLAFEIENGMLDDDCYLTVTGISRYNSESDAYSIESAYDIIYDWTITTPTTSNLPQEVRLGESFYFSASFTPDNSGESTDTFEIAVDVYNAIDELKESCSFIIVLNGLGCQNYCPTLLINNYSDAYLSPDTIDVGIGDSVSFGNSYTLHQSVTGYINTSCEDLSEANSQNLSYEILINENNRENMCSELNIDVNISGDDAAYFESWFTSIINTTSSYSGFTGVPIDFGIIFEPPTIDDYLNDTNHDYSCNVTITAYNEDGFECTQEIVIEATTVQISSKTSGIHTMYTFSQISDYKAEPTLSVFSIPDNVNGTPVSYLESDEVTESEGFTIPKELYTGDASFYFDVDKPTDISVTGQYPELYLMNTIGNSFSYITMYPIANYSTTDDFKDDLDNIVKKVFNSSGFTYGSYTFSFNEGSDIMWNNSMSKRDFDDTRNGVELDQGNVYIIWNPNSEEVNTTAEDIYGGYCEVAFIYISGLTHGTETTNGDHLGTVKFMVAYPLSIVK